MRLPPNLQQAIEEELQPEERAFIVKAREELSDSYRKQKHPSNQPYMNKDAHRKAYLASRLPATFATITKVLQEIRHRLPDLQVRSLLDLGAGPGTAMWSAVEFFPELEQVTLIENDGQLTGIGKRLAEKSDHLILQKAKWMNVNLENVVDLSPADIIILSYSIGELSPQARKRLIGLCWDACKQLLIIIEPGTPIGFERIRTIRDQLLSLGSYIVAPCPHSKSCPIADNDWCHFFARIQRTSLHRQIKGGTLGYEDEKFSYIAVSRSPVKTAQARVIRHPQKRSGHILLTLCTSGCIEEKIVSKRDPEDYKQTRHLEWGDEYKQS